ncbi:MAG: hypothetical protein L6R43_09610 [Planctomycetes bacterium]|nr:hypothetical protein [Planctomycetota bacterium]
MRPLPCAAALLLAAGTVLSSPPAPVPETEPTGFTTPPPQFLGLLGAEGLAVAGALDPTSPTGLDPGDRDGFSFTTGEAGPLAATLEAAPGATFLLALAVEGESGPRALGAVSGPAPLTLSVPDLEAGRTWRVGVAAFADGAPLPYTLTLSREDALPPWDGSLCPGETVAAEPDGSAAEAGDLGPFTGVRCARGTLDSVVPPGFEGEGDEDFLRFRNVLPVAARLRFRADPGLLRVEAYALSFVGLSSIGAAAFGEAGALDLPALSPGADYFLRVRADQGEAPLDWSLVLEPLAAPREPEAAPLELTAARVRLQEPSFRVDGTFPPGTGADLGSGVPLSWTLRGAGGEIGEGVLTQDGRGRLVHRAPAGTPGLRRLILDPLLGRFRMRGGGLPFAAGAADPLLDLRLTLGGIEMAGEAEAEFRAGGKVLVLRRPDPVR